MLTICQALSESLDIKTHYKPRNLRAAWYQQRKPEITEQKFRSAKDKQELGPMLNTVFVISWEKLNSTYNDGGSLVNNFLGGVNGRAFLPFLP